MHFSASVLACSALTLNVSCFNYLVPSNNTQQLDFDTCCLQLHVIRRANAQMSLDEFTAVPSPRVLKTHAPRQLFLGVEPDDPPSLCARGRPMAIAPGTRVIYVSRNAKVLLGSCHASSFLYIFIVMFFTFISNTYCETGSFYTCLCQCL